MLPWDPFICDRAFWILLTPRQTSKEGFMAILRLMQLRLGEFWQRLSVYYMILRTHYSPNLLAWYHQYLNRCWSLSYGMDLDWKGVVIEGNGVLCFWLRIRICICLAPKDVTMTRVGYPTFPEGRTKAVTTSREMFGLPIRHSRCKDA